MNFTKLALTAITGLGLLAAAPAAFADPVIYSFSVSGALTKNAEGVGYGIDRSENGGQLLDVQFAESFSAKTFSLKAVNESASLEIGSVLFAETDAGGNNAGIRENETDNLVVFWTFTFADPSIVTMKISATGTATIGSVSDTHVDYKLVWDKKFVDFVDIVDIVDFDDGSQLGISLNDLFFSATDQNEDQRATFTLLKLPNVINPPVVQDVPEPASLALVGLALAGLAATRRRKQASS